MELDFAHILELVGLETILGALLVGTLASTLYFRGRTRPISLNLSGPEAGEHR